jgi:hypothetical protein
MPDALAAAGVVAWNSRYSKNQTSMFALLTSVSEAHHQARGFDRACRINRIDRSKYDRNDI